MFTYAAATLNAYQLAYLHILEALPGHMLAADGESVQPHIRHVFDGPLIRNGGYDAVSGVDEITTHQAVAYGMPFIANLPERFAQNAPLNEPDPSTFYTLGPQGYTDHPTLEQLPVFA
jgi:N-ethylmaleimide reductase